MPNDQTRILAKPTRRYYLRNKIFLSLIAVAAFTVVASLGVVFEILKNKNFDANKITQTLMPTADKTTFLPADASAKPTGASVKQPANKKERYLFFAPPAEVIHFTLGFQDVLADIFWLRFLQDSDTCEQSLAPVGASRVGVGHTANCNQGWGYHMLDVIFEAAPRWKYPAAVGPMMLSVIIDDIEGATLAFKKSVRNYPNDWQILFRAGYHFLNETNEHELAAKYFDDAGKLGAPGWVHSLAAKLYSENGRLTIARVVLIDALKRVPEGVNRYKIEERLKEIEEKISKLKK
ncbi:MAG: hypothetical protein ABL927_03065 [Bdellovibrionales bacterium]